MIRTDGTPTIASRTEPYSAKAKIVSTRERELEREVERLKGQLLAKTLETASLRRSLERVL